MSALGREARPGASVAAAPSTRRRRAWRRAWIPHQHGAWPMIAVPVIAGVLRSGGDRVQIPAVVAWVATYGLFDVASRRHVARRKAPFRAPLITYALAAAVLGGLVLVLRPDVLAWAPAFVPSLVVGATCVRLRRERALVNDIALMAAACLFGLVVYQLGYDPGGTIGVGWSAMWAITLALFAYFVGSALYVKTLIRERGSRVYRVLSVGYHLVVTLGLFTLAELPTRPVGVGHRACLALAAVFALLTVRAAALAGRRIRPGVAGIGEMVACLALLAVVVVWR